MLVSAMTARKRDAPKNRTVEYVVDLSRRSLLMAAQKAELEALKAKPDSAIDYSDIPPLSDAFWKAAVRNPFLKPPTEPQSRARKL
jgi:hypothetical protein